MAARTFSRFTSKSTPRSNNPSGVPNMNSVPRSGRFDPRWTSRAIGNDEPALLEDSDAGLPFESEPWTDDPAGRDVDEALEQIASEGCLVCPLCGAIVASDGSVLG
jgi:hypothetical protein